MDFTRDALFGFQGPWRDTMQVCLDGHVINDEVKAEPQNSRAMCPEDGKQTIVNCPSCNGQIFGKTHYPGGLNVAGITTDAPQYCEHDGCGKPFPWTGKEPERKPVVVTADVLNRIFERFDLVAKQLRQRHDGRGTLDVRDEYDVQDLLHSLLRLFFDDVRLEEWTPSHAGKSARMDFLLKSEQAVVETKMARKALTHKELGDELIVDIARYKSHPDCKTLWCFVYDPNGYVRNPRGIENDLSKKHGGLEAKVVIRGS